MSQSKPQSRPRVHTDTSRHVLSTPLVIVLSIFLVGVGVWFFSPYLGAICLSAIMAYLFSPLYKWLSRHMPQTAAAWSTLLVSALVVVVPLLYVGVTVVSQGITAVNTLSHVDTSAGSPLMQTVTKVNQVTSSFGFPITPSSGGSSDGIIGFIKNTLPSIVNFGIKALTQIAVNAPAFFTSLIIYIFMFVAILRYRTRLSQFVLDISPFESRITELYLRRSGMVVAASMRGQLIISLVTAILSAALLSLIGYQSYFLLLVTVFTVLGMIPLGSGVVVIPICLVTMVAGNFWPGFFALLFYLVVICNIDNILRPRLMPKDASLVPVLTITATFCGLYYFGIMGVVYGPLIAIILSTTASILIEYNKSSRQHVATADPR